MQLHDVMSKVGPTRRFRIVAALDRSEYSEIVLEHAIDQAARHDAPDLHFVTVVDRKHPDLDAVKAWLATEVMQGLESFGRQGPDWRSRLHVLEGKPADEIATFAADLAADLLVIGRFGAHERHGSITDQVVPRAPCPTLVVNLTEHVVDPVTQCAACVELREASDGERWFCAEHSNSDRLRLSTLLPLSGPSVHGGTLW
jgi:nucleotide-binding universal stress UspA family protein